MNSFNAWPYWGSLFTVYPSFLSKNLLSVQLSAVPFHVPRFSPLSLLKIKNQLPLAFIDIMHSTSAILHRPLSNVYLCSWVSSETHPSFYENWLKKLVGLGYVKLTVLCNLTDHHKSIPGTKKRESRVLCKTEQRARQQNSVHKARIYLHFPEKCPFDRLVGLLP